MKVAQSLRLKGKNTGHRSEYDKQRIKEGKQANPYICSDETKLKLSKSMMGSKGE